ncbi:hypothetical protein B1R94_13545 [Mycolicibacterium litorale]|nr:hypothetical protein B1R94_13545 [Mycolicibacterium litorale]
MDVPEFAVSAASDPAPGAAASVKSVARAARTNPLVKPAAVALTPAASASALSAAATPSASASVNPLAGFLHAVVSLLGLNRPTPPPDPIGALLWGLVQQVAAVVGVAPRAGTPTVSTPVATTGLVTGTLGFTDSSGQPLTYTYTGPTNGTVAVSADGAYSYTPTVDARLAAAGGTGPTTDTFTVTAFNGIASAHETVTVPISPDIPVAGTATTSAPNSVTGAVSGGVTASDPAGRPLTYSITTGPSKGTITQFDPVTGKFTYTPTKSAQLATEVAGVVGADTFTVAASNGAASATVTVHVVVDPGHPQAGVVTIDTTDPKTGIVTGTAAFTDPAGGQLVYSVGANPSNGKVVVHNDGTYTYTPNADTTATADAFAITVSNGVHSVTQTISVPINTEDAIVGAWNITGSDPAPSWYPENWVATIVRTGDQYTQTITVTDDGVTDAFHYGTFTRTGAREYTAVDGSYDWSYEDALQYVKDSLGEGDVLSNYVYDPYTVWTLSVSDDGQTITEIHTVTETYTITAPAGHTWEGEGVTLVSSDDSTNTYAFDHSWSETTIAVKASDSTVLDIPVPGTPIVSDPDPDTGVVTGVAVFTDPEGAALVYSVSVSPTRGVITQFDTGTGEFTYTPNADASGASDSFAVTATNGRYQATESISVPINVAAQDAFTGVWNVTSSVNSNLDGSNPQPQQFPDGYSYTFSITKSGNGYTATVSLSTAGTTLFSQDIGALTKTGPNTYTGSITPAGIEALKQQILKSYPDMGGSVDLSDFIYTVDSTATLSEDGQTMTYVALVHQSYTLVVTAADGSTSVSPYQYEGRTTFTAAKAVDTPVAGTPVLNAADPDSGVVTGAAVFTDPAGAELTYSVSTSPTKGTITEFNTATGEFTYTPNGDATGVRDTFVVTATNGVADATETITVPVMNAIQDALSGTWQVTGSYSGGQYIPVPADYGAALVFAHTVDGYTVEWTVGDASMEFGTWAGSSEPLLLLETGPGLYSGSVPSAGNPPSTLVFQAYLADDGQSLTWSGGLSGSAQFPIFTAAKPGAVVAV